MPKISFAYYSYPNLCENEIGLSEYLTVVLPMLTWSISEKILSDNVAFSALRFFPPPVRNVQSPFCRILTLIGPPPKNGEIYLNHIYSNLKVMNKLYFKFGPNWARNGKVIPIILRKMYFPFFFRCDMKCPKSLILILPKLFSFINSFIASPMRICIFFNLWTLYQ